MNIKVKVFSGCKPYDRDSGLQILNRGQFIVEGENVVNEAPQKMNEIIESDK